MPRGETFAGRLQQLREAAALSQYELAKRAGLTRQTLSRLEAGGSEPTWTTVRLLARVLGIPVASFEVGELPLPNPGAGRPRGRPRKGTAEQAAAPTAPKGRLRKGK